MIHIGDTLPDPFFMQYIQEFSIKQGVVGSQTRVNSGFVFGIYGKRGPMQLMVGEVFKLKKEEIFGGESGEGWKSPGGIGGG